MTVLLYWTALGQVRTEHYLKAFERMDAVGRALAHWNWVAAFLTLGWLLYWRLWSAALAYTGAYLLLAALPGDAIIARYANPDLGLTDAQIQAIREALGADQPLIVQYVKSIAGFLTGDFGYSVASGAAVSDLIATALPATLTLAVLGLGLAIFLGVVIAFTATYGRGTWLRRFFRGLPPFFVSLPVFWIGIILIQIFSFRLGLVPVIGANPVQALILPVRTLVLSGSH